EGNTPNEEDIIIACKLAVRYSKGKDEEEVQVKFGHVSTNFKENRTVCAMTQEEADKYNVN
ncbi:MAG: tRNA 4-thiouridine(8) synthase ThiI, partial [Clostridium sp.]|nr:tRNA 4-thiouridine(8) synthase ThiI [Clostridium sp.]